MAEYIEREALIQRIENSPLFTNFGEDGYFIHNGVIDIIKRLPTGQPTADVAEVRHGEWVEYWDDNYLSFCHKCSECDGFPLAKEETTHDEVLSFYCPHCGAKMDGKGDGE